MKTVVVHIGPHKTGSTSLQAALRNNRAELEKAGVLYPLAGSGSTNARIYGQHNLAWELLGGYRFKPELGTWGDLKDEIDGSGCSHVFVSSEALSQLNADAVRRIATKLIGYDVRIVYVARHQSDTIRSVYSQVGVKWNVRGAADFYRKYVENRISSPFDRTLKRNSSVAIRTFLHRPKIETWIETFGRDAVHIIFPDDLGNYFYELADAVGLPALRDFKVPKLNTPRSLAHIGIVTSVCRALEGSITPDEFNIELAPFISSLFAGSEKSLPCPKGLPQDVITLIEPYTAEDVAWLEQYATVPARWKEPGGSEGFTEPDIPNKDTGRLLASDYLKRRIERLDRTEQEREDGDARNAVRQRKERLQEVLDNLLAS